MEDAGRKKPQCEHCDGYTYLLHNKWKWQCISFYNDLKNKQIIGTTDSPTLSASSTLILLKFINKFAAWQFCPT